MEGSCFFVGGDIFCGLVGSWVYSGGVIFSLFLLSGWDWGNWKRANLSLFEVYKVIFLWR